MGYTLKVSRCLLLPSGASHVAPLHGEEEPLLLDGENPHLLVRGQIGRRSLMNNKHGSSHQ